MTRRGSTEPIDIDARIIAATNANIREAVQEKRFREDLFFRLGEYMISIPPLRERADDIPFLALKFCSEAAMELRKISRPFQRMLRTSSRPIHGRGIFVS
jgi:transcriptional regulator with GAF, ATPase, and Fis domain